MGSSLEGGQHLNAGASRTASAERRYQARRSGLWAAQLQSAEGDPIPCLILDLSPGGARLAAQRRPFTEGMIVTLLAPVSGTRRARVAWMTRAHVGLQFLGHTIDSKFRPF